MTHSPLVTDAKNVHYGKFSLGPSQPAFIILKKTKEFGKSLLLQKLSKFLFSTFEAEILLILSTFLIFFFQHSSTKSFKFQLEK